MRVSAYGVSAIVGVLCLCSLAIVLSQAVFGSAHGSVLNGAAAHSMTPDQERVVIRSAESLRQRRAVQVLGSNIRSLFPEGAIKDAASLAAEQEAAIAAAAAVAASEAAEFGKPIEMDTEEVDEPNSPAAYRNAKDSVNSVGAADAAVALGNDMSEDATESSEALEADAANGVAAQGSELQGDLIVGILTDPESLRSLGMASYTTWARDLEPHFTVRFFLGDCQADVAGFPGQVICLDTPDVYPPQTKEFLLWKYMHDHFLGKFKWFMKADQDSYINVVRMRRMMAHITAQSPLSDRPAYIGLPATGRPEERDKLGLDGKTYCSGLGYLINSHTLAAVENHWTECLDRVVSNHSDTETGRCIHQYANVQCEAISEDYPFKQVYYQQDGHHVFPMKLIKGGQMALIFPKEPKSSHFSAVLIHPLKRAEDFYRFHKQVVSQLRPIQPAISKDSYPVSYQQAIRDLRTTCVNNPARQVERSKFFLPECSSPLAQEAAVVPTYAYVLSRDAENSDEIFDEISALLAENGIRAIRVPVPGWRPDSASGSSASSTSGSSGSQNPPPASVVAYNQVVRGLFRNATFSGARRIAIFEDKVIFSCNFKQEIWKLLNNQRCADHLFTEQQGGVLLMGSDEISPEGMDLIESDRSQAFADSTRDVRAALCYNINSFSSGSFAGIYHRSVFGEVLSWIDRYAAVNKDRSFDQVYSHLADKGYIVRSAFPNLVLRDESTDIDTSSLSARQIAIKLRWSEGRFCRRGGAEKIIN